MWYHVLSRGNRREAVFHKDGDYAAFVVAMVEMREPGCPSMSWAIRLMPNHFHLVLRPKADGDLGRWMQWLLTAHARRYHRHHGSSGHVGQGRFKAFPIQHDDHGSAVLRYVERNPARAEPVAGVEDWAWSSVPGCRQKDPLLYRGTPPCGAHTGYGPSTRRPCRPPTAPGFATPSPEAGRSATRAGRGRRPSAWAWSHASGLEAARRRPRDGESPDGKSNTTIDLRRCRFDERRAEKTASQGVCVV